MSVILLSGGLDSTVNAAEEALLAPPTLALTVDYGQRSAQKEIASAANICAALGIRHEIIALPWLGALTHTSLVARDQAVPEPDDTQLDDLNAALRTAEAVWVPNRNGIFLNIAAAWAESLGVEWVIAGFNIEEAQTFPDNSPQFVAATNSALAFSTRGRVRVRSHTAELTKTEVFRRARQIDAPIWLSWSCYHDGAEPCGRCESCKRFRRGLRESGCDAWFHERQTIT